MLRNGFAFACKVCHAFFLGSWSFPPRIRESRSGVQVLAAPSRGSLRLGFQPPEQKHEILFKVWHGGHFRNQGTRHFSALGNGVMRFNKWAASGLQFCQIVEQPDGQGSKYGPELFGSLRRLVLVKEVSLV